MRKGQPMETIFDYDPTPEELRYLAEPDAAAYRAVVSHDGAMVDLAMLFALRDDEPRADGYARQIADPTLRFQFTHEDLIPPNRAANRTSSTTNNRSKAA